MTDTAYLYQYFLENSTAKKLESTEEKKTADKKADGKEGKNNGKHSK